jgi:hypothetical protein
MQFLLKIKSFTKPSIFRLTKMEFRIHRSKINELTTLIIFMSKSVEGLLNLSFNAWYKHLQNYRIACGSVYTFSKICSEITSIISIILLKSILYYSWSMTFFSFLLASSFATESLDVTTELRSLIEELKLSLSELWKEVESTEPLDVTELLFSFYWYL